jgi:tetratricopeptide (TPR) repeat protein
MTADNLYPGYIARGEEDAIREELNLVQADCTSRAVLLYGPGGVGKTSLVRGMARAGPEDRVIWLEPVDVDDPEFWLLSTLEHRVADQLDPEHRYFGPYLTYLSRLPSSTQPRIGHETVVSHLGRIKRVFVDCYTDFVQDTGFTVVMVFDTVEAIRGVYLLYTLTQWMKALPGTLFILSGRPQVLTGGPPDPIRSELEDPYQRMPVRVVPLAELAQEEAERYLEHSSIVVALTSDERDKLVLLTRGHPLWLAFTLSYLADYGFPEEAADSLETIERQVPYRGELTPEGQQLHEAFKRELVTPYQSVDFWHEAVKRLAVVRQSVNQEVWRRLMDDRSLPDTAPDLDLAWEQLLQTPWIRTRANGRYVTLHDAVAEELAQRIIPLHDQDQQWRRYLWSRAARIYSELTERPEVELAANLTTLNDRLRQMEERLQRELNDAATAEETRREEAEETASIQEAARLDAQKRELDQFRAASLYYRLLCDFADGSGFFLTLFERARSDRDVFFQDRLALEIQRFLPGSAHAYALDDIIGIEVERFGEWLLSDGMHYYLRISLRISDYLIENERSPEAIELLNSLPREVTAIADDVQGGRLNLLKGNAYMRIPDEVDAGLPYFDLALNNARKSANSHRLAANAYNEMGYYYRNGGYWEKAEESYQSARDEISESLLARDADQDHEDLASIQTNWAYLKGLRGEYRDGTSLVESAIKVRRRLGLLHQEGISWSVCGEVYRYERQFQEAWDAFSVAEEIMQGQRNWSWLGVIYQQQAICLFQASQYNVELERERQGDTERPAIDRARRRIVWALDICRDQNIRAYPSALNRAGRIFAEQEPETALNYLREGINQARRLSDGWFWFANLTEFAELNYEVYRSTGDRMYRDQIHSLADPIAEVAKRYQFSDLEGRWSLLQGHLAIRDATVSGDPSGLSSALDNYKKGFMKIASGYVGSSGAPVLPREFSIFRDLFVQLPPDVKAHWLREFRREWSEPSRGSTQLLARLEELY